MAVIPYDPIIEKFVLKNKDATLEEIKQYYLSKTQIEVSLPAIFRLLNKLDLQPLKPK